MENTLLDSHNTSQMLPGNKATSGPEHFQHCQESCRISSLVGPQSGPASSQGRRQSLLCPTCPRHDPEVEACLHHGLLLL